MPEPTLFDDLPQPDKAPDTPPAPSGDLPPDPDTEAGAAPEAPGESHSNPETPNPDPDERETLFLADALALAYRAFFSMKNASMNAPDGTDTRTLYGFATALLKLLEDHQPEQIAVVFDAIGPGGTFRDDLYAEYKSHRPPMPEEIKDCLPLIKDLCQGFDIPVLEHDGYEADDVIGTLARRAESEGVDVVIFSADKDFRQLLSDPDTGAGAGAVQMLRPPYMGEVFNRETAETFRESYDGLEPVQFIDLLALEGDKADNVPGVPGIGKKTALTLIQTYGSVENLLDHADEIKGKRGENLRTYADDARLSKQLVTIHTDVELNGPDGGPLDWHTLRRTDPDVGALNHLFDHVGFGQRLRTRVKDYAEGRERTRGRRGGSRRTAPALPEDDPSLAFDFGPYTPVTAMDEDAVDYRTVYSRDELPRAATEAEGSPLAFDTETTSTDAMEASLVGLSLSSKEKRAVYVPTPLPDGTQTEAALDAVRARLGGDVEKVGHNVKYDLLVLGRHGVSVAGPFFDTMVAHYLVNPEASHKLDDVSSFYLNYRPQPITDLIGTGKDARSMRDVPVEDVGPYACEDADITLRLAPLLREKLDADGLLEIAETIEFPLIPVLADMERAGVKVDPTVLDAISLHLGEEMERLEAQVFEIAGRTFNIGSPKQLGEVLFNPPPTEAERAASVQWEQDVRDNEAGTVAGDPDAKPKTKKQLKEEAPTFGIGLEPLDKTSSGAPSTAEKVLNELSLEHALPALVLDWRKLSKLKSTYADKLPELIHPETGRIHTDFNQTVTATGRLSSSNPNLQNIPVRTEIGREIRRAFVAPEGFQLMAADYAQIELRLIAHMSGDPGLVEAFREGRDIHTATAARVFGVAYDDVTRTMRSQVKQVNYGIPYGVSAFGLAYRMRISNSEAQGLIDQYRQSYPDVIRFLDDLVRDARERGYAETLLGRRRYLPNLGARNPNDRAFAERVAVNMPIQGTQADMIKRAMVAIHARLGAVSERARMILQVHDELVFEVPEADTEAVSTFVREEMIAALPLDVPVVVDVGVADNWLDAH